MLKRLPDYTTQELPAGHPPITEHTDRHKLHLDIASRQQGAPKSAPHVHDAGFCRLEASKRSRSAAIGDPASARLPGICHHTLLRVGNLLGAHASANRPGDRRNHGHQDNPHNHKLEVLLHGGDAAEEVPQQRE